MATTQPYTLQTLQDQIHTLLEGDPDTPETTDDDWSARLVMVNNAIMSWESEREANWSELWGTNTSGGTVTAGTTTYSTPSDFKAGGGFVRLVDGDGNYEEVPVVSPDKAQLYTDTDKVAYFTGNPASNYSLNLRWTPATGDGLVGRTIQYDYYKYAEQLASTTDEAEMSDPTYIVYKVVAQVYGQRSNFNMYTVYETMAQNALNQMKIANATDGAWQDNEIVDVGYGFGL